MIWVVLIASLVVSSIIVNGVQRLYMKIIGASGMYFSGAKKLIVIVLIALFLAALAMRALGINIAVNIPI